MTSHQAHARETRGPAPTSIPVSSKTTHSGRSFIALSFAILGAAFIYSQFLEVRVTIPDSDLTRVTAEFSAPGMSPYNWREPIYWAFGKALTSVLGDPWSTLFVLDSLALGCIFLAIRSRMSYSVFIVVLFLSPLFVLGLNNIHRQFVGFALWLIVERKTAEKGVYRSALWHLIPFLVHTSMGLLSAIYYLTYAIIRRDFRIVILLTGIPALVFVLSFEQAAALFREGTETNTSIFLYSAWASAAAFPVILFAKKFPFIALFYFFSGLVAAGLFLLSGGSSGSRFFIMFITVADIWIVGGALSANDYSRVTRSGILALICALLLAPTFINDFSNEILTSAFYGKQFGLNR